MKDHDSSQSNLAANLLSQLVEQDTVGFSDFNTAPFQLFNDGLSNKNPLHESSFTGRNLSTLESTSIDLAHQIGNSLLGRNFDNSNELIGSLSPLYKINAKPFQILSQQFLNSLRNGLDSYTDVDSVLIELNNYGGPNLRLISRVYQ